MKPLLYWLNQPGVVQLGGSLAHFRRVLGGVLLTAGLLAILAAVVGWILSPERYEAVVRLQIDPPLCSFLLPEGEPTGAGLAAYVEVQRELLRSRSLLATVVRKERLTKVEGWSGEQDLVSRLSRSVDVRPVIFGRLIDVRVAAEDPQRAASIANTLASEFIDRSLALRQEMTSSVLFFFRNQASGLEGEVAKAEEDLHNYRMRTKYVSFEPELSPIPIGLRRAQADYADAKSRARAASSIVASMDQHVASGQPLSAFPPIDSDPQLQHSRLELAQLEIELAERLPSHEADDPATRVAHPKLESSRRLLDRLAHERAELLRAEAAVARGLEDEQQAVVGEWEQQMMEWNRASIEYDELRRKSETKKTLYGWVLARLAELDVVQKERFSNIRIVDPARVPVEPAYPLRKLALLLFAAGVVTGLIGMAVGPSRRETPTTPAA